MGRRERRKFTPEFRAEAVRLAKMGDRPMAHVARDLGIKKQTLGHWVHQAEVDAAGGSSGELTTSEKEELKQLRKENARLREEKEILKKATAFFARENK